MVFIMPLFINTRRVNRGWQFALIFLCWGISLNLWAQPEIRDVNIRLAGQTYLLDARIDYELNPTLLEALHSGISLSFGVNFQISRERELLWDEAVSSFSRQYQLRYHALSRQYLLRYANTGLQNAFPSLSSALTAMGALNEVPLIKKVAIKANNMYRVKLQASLDIEALPAPLRTVAYLSSDWHYSSDWYTCPLSAQK